jgi:hypothetical protein
LVRDSTSETMATGLHFQPTSLDLGRVISEKQKTGGIALPRDVRLVDR